MLTVTSRERRRDGWGFKDLTETNLYPIQSLPHTIHNLYSQGSLSSMMTNRPVRPQAFRSSSRLLPRAWACTGNEDHWPNPTAITEEAHRKKTALKTTGSTIRRLRRITIR